MRGGFSLRIAARRQSLGDIQRGAAGDGAGGGPVVGMMFAHSIGAPAFVSKSPLARTWETLRPLTVSPLRSAPMAPSSVAFLRAFSTALRPAASNGWLAGQETAKREK